MLALLFASLTAVAGISMLAMDFGTSEEDEEPSEEKASSEAPDLLDGVKPTEVVTAGPMEEIPLPEPPVHVSDPGSDVTGTDGADDITLQTGAVGDPGHVEFSDGGLIYVPDEDADQINQVDSGAGDDTIVAEDGVAVIETGEGADFVDASGLQGGVVIAGAGDVIDGSDVTGDPTAPISVTRVGAELHGAATFNGGAAHEMIAAFGDGATVDGGGGDDVILGFDGSTTLAGGDGNDIIDAHAHLDEYDQLSGDSTASGDGHADLVDGGAGDDRLYIDGGDTVTGGTGADRFVGEFDLGAASEPIVVTDFDPSEDLTAIYLHGAAAETVSADDLEIIETSGDSHLFAGGELVAIFEDISGLSADGSLVENRGADGAVAFRIAVR